MDSLAAQRATSAITGQALLEGQAQHTHNANGYLASKRNPATGATTVYAYDAVGNLMSVTLPDGTQIEYVIDGTNRRIGKKDGGVLVQGFLYDGPLNIVAELDGNNQVVSRFVPGGMIRAGTTYRILRDQLGSPRLVVNAQTGEVVQRMDYDELGNVIADTNPGFQPFGFAGGLRDPDTGLIRFGARDYDPGVGRWTAKDPILFAGGDTNLYSYARNDPVNFVDLDGRKVTNTSGYTIYIKPELTGDAVPLLPGEVYPGDQDGISTPVRPCEVFKTANHFDIIIDLYGLPVPSYQPDAQFHELIIGHLMQLARGNWKTKDWLEMLHKKTPPDPGWDNLFKAADPGCTCP